jgi:lipoate-protein ligase A
MMDQPFYMVEVSRSDAEKMQTYMFENNLQHYFDMDERRVEKVERVPLEKINHFTEEHVQELFRSLEQEYDFSFEKDHSDMKKSVQEMREAIRDALVSELIQKGDKDDTFSEALLRGVEDAG